MRKLPIPEERIKYWFPPIYLCCDGAKPILLLEVNLTVHIEVKCKKHRTFFASNAFNNSRFELAFQLSKKLKRQFKTPKIEVNHTA